MNYKDALTEIEKLENGADILAAIKGETTRLNGEAKGHREKGEATAKKLAEVLGALKIAEDSDVAEEAKKIAADLSGFRASGTPDEVTAKITTLNSDVAAVKKQLKAMTEKANVERAKRLDAMKHSAAVDALTKGNAASPQEMAKLIADKLTISDDEKVIFTGSDGAQKTVDDGVKDWLNANSWAVKINQQPGGGSGGSAGGGEDAFLKGFNS